MIVVWCRGYRGELVNMKRMGKKSGKFKCYYMVLFQEYVLFYPFPSGSKPDAQSRPLSTAHPSDWIRLDTFNYHVRPPCALTRPQ